jgi:hypothetical protein
MESWQNGYCTGLENRRPQGLGGSNPSLSAQRLRWNRGIGMAGTPSLKITPTNYSDNRI